LDRESAGPKETASRIENETGCLPQTSSEQNDDLVVKSNAHQSSSEIVVSQESLVAVGFQPVIQECPA
jgi:hypothetical protein